MPLDYVALAEGGMPAGQLAETFIVDYFEDPNLGRSFIA